MKNLILLMALFTSFAASAELSDGMKETLPLNYLEKKQFIDFENFRERPRAPIAAGININGQPVRSMEEIFKVFGEIVSAYLPDGETIKSSTDEAGKEVWRYPVGTQVVHVVTFNDDQNSVFELRMMERVDDKRWAFGVYHIDGNQYKLQHYTGLLPKEYHVKGKDGEDYQVKLKHIPLHVCQNCHRNTTSAPHQYENLQDVGPCEFTAQNPKVKNEWFEAFKTSRGYEPVVKIE